MTPPEEWPRTTEHYMAVDGGRMVFEVNKTPERAAAEPERTISEAAMAAMLLSIDRYVGTRVLRAMRNGHRAHSVAVHVYVEIDGQAAE